MINIQLVMQFSFGFCAYFSFRFVFAFVFELLYPSKGLPPGNPYPSPQNVTFFFFCVLFLGIYDFAFLDTCIDDNCYDFSSIPFTNYDLFLFDSFFLVFWYVLWEEIGSSWFYFFFLLDLAFEPFTGTLKPKGEV
jgi:hypothetical protein